ncbi:alpha/beta fold hydrolase [Actinomycetospora cinnamomea]|uniref:Pimeloyl-ACP methyl ester carboxylesterase n=1 Tax=Actinomycetospora cinnamomea TaxID=663609 RepID=A0A2U1FHW9_9PSEU|nr:alpha/beta hydrolase [Actinomycetospora cinnamomea]PVZ11766.1 pimeloyl-ACP methyl ester carboxylesterase [Actinomycetospora cinnamomea]
MREDVARGRDGTSLRLWDNEARGPAVVISNGIGASHGSWPLLATPTCGIRAVGWHHRGLAGSERPADERRIRLEDHADDLEAVMDEVGFERAVLVGWSLGVGIAFEVARRAPERVAGILAVGGAPGAPFQLLRVPPGTPPAAREQLGRTSAWMLRWVGPPVAAAGSVWSSSVSSVDLGAGHHPASGALADTIRTFAGHDWEWFSRLVLEASRPPAHEPVPAVFPVTVVAGSFDAFVDPLSLRRRAEAIPAGRFVVLPGSHFLPVQQPDAVHAELVELINRAVDATDAASGS